MGLCEKAKGEEMKNLFGENNWLYENNADNSARFVLGEKGNNPLICIGVNPSTAEPGKLDPTLRNVKAWSKRLGYDGWIMLNLYPQRATNPNDLHEGYNCPMVEDNLNCWYKTLRQNKGAVIWAAWGTLIEKRFYLSGWLENLAKAAEFHNCKWITIGKLSNAGHPHHPLYLSAKSEPKPFDIDNYLKKLNK